MNEKSLAFFERMANDPNSNQNSVKMAKNSDFSKIDAEFILKYAPQNASLLDLGSGTGLIVNKIYNQIAKIVAVEPFQKFSNYIIKAPNIEIINKTFDQFDTDEQFDLITSFGVLFYFNKEEATQIYKKYYKNLKKNGALIVKNQFSVKETVTIAGYSEELKQDYFAQYRYLKEEIELLKECGYQNVESFDIYPPECNRWENTHFYALVARSK